MLLTVSMEDEARRRLTAGRGAQQDFAARYAALVREFKAFLEAHNVRPVPIRHATHTTNAVGGFDWHPTGKIFGYGWPLDLPSVPIPHSGVTYWYPYALMADEDDTLTQLGDRTIDGIVAEKVEPARISIDRLRMGMVEYMHAVLEGARDPGVHQ